MTDVSKVFPWMTRQIDRRSFLNRTSSATFGVLAGLAVGARPSTMEARAFPCFGLPDCRSYSTQFCSGSTCACNPSHNFCCSPANFGCHSAGGDCWSSQGKKCCDCSCSYCSPCNTVNCICFG